MDSIFAQLALVLTLASIFGFLVKLNKLPLIIAYLLVGIVLSAIAIFSFNQSAVSVFPDVGIAFVLFLIGMELDLREIGSLGKPILISGLVQIIISGIAGVTLASLFGFKGPEAFYLGIGLSFSSTVVVVKMLLERDDLTSLYGKLSIGITLLEDLVAIILLMFLSLNSSVTHFSLSDSYPLVVLILKGLALLGIAFVCAKYILPKVFKAVSDSTELLFLTALTWCFVFISLAMGFGFSVIIGAFLAGVSLASSAFHYHISSRIKPMRDFFIVLFFVYIGTQVGFKNILEGIPLIVIFTLYALILKPLIFSLLLGAFGFRKHTIFQSSLTLGQISEFSLIILLVGVKLGLVGENSLSVMALTVVVSIICSSLLINNSRSIYSYLRPFLAFFERKGGFHHIEHRQIDPLEDHVVLIGANRVGGPIVEHLKKEGIPFVVLDFNPEIVGELQKRGITAIYGDISDSEITDVLNLNKARLVISTATDLSDNKILLSELKRLKSPAKVVVRVTEEDDIKDIKERGADYVLLPEDVSADFIVDQLKTHWPSIHFRNLS